MSASNTTQVFTFTFVEGPKGKTNYTVATQPSVEGNRYSYGLESPPEIGARDGFIARYNLYGSWYENFELSPDASPLPVVARSCHSVLTTYCSDPIEITARTVPTVVVVQFQECVPANTGDLFVVSRAARGSYSTILTPNIVDGTSVIDARITWSGAYAPLKSITHRAPLCTQPDLSLIHI